MDRDRNSSSEGPEITVVLIPTASVLDYLPDCDTWLKKAAERSWNGMPYSYVHQGVVNGDMQLWFMYHESLLLAAAVTYIYKPFTVRLCRILVAGGRVSERWVLGFTDAIEKFARLNKCDAIEVYGRPGWRRAARRTRFKQVGSVFCKRI